MANIKSVKLADILKVRKSRTFLRLLPGLILLVPFVLTALFVPFFPLQDPMAISTANTLQPPSFEHFFGTDTFGMDVFSRVLHATRIDFLISILCVLVAVSVGAPLGAVAGYFGGFLDTIISRFTEIFQSFPIFLLAIITRIILGPSDIYLAVAIGICIAPFYIKLVRSIVKPLQDIDYIQAAKVGGQTSLQIIFRYLIPNSFSSIASQFTLSVAVSIRIVAGLSFLGLGVPTPNPEWGSMIQIGAGWVMFGKWWVSVFPGLALFFTIWSLSHISQGLESTYTLKEQ